MFELPDDPAYRHRRPAVSLAGLFWTQLAATTVGVLIAGFVLLFCLRLYIHWSVSEAVESIRSEIKSIKQDASVKPAPQK